MCKFHHALENHWPMKDWTIATGPAASCRVCLREYGFDPDLTAESPEFDAAQEYMYEHSEGSFSWSACESCGSTLGGNRHDAHAIHREAFGPNAKRPDEVRHITICTDCLLYHANGDEPEAWEQ